MGIVISFEGLPGVGKTSAVNHVYEHLIQKGYRVAKLSDLHSYEGDRVGNKVFKLMKYNNDDFCRLDDPFHEAFLSQAIRYSLVNETILKANDQYDVVLEDRGIDTMFSYMLARLRQVYKLSFGQINEWLQVLNEPLGCFPDQTIYLHDQIENCRARHLLRNGGETHPFSDWLFLSQVQEAYSFLSEIHDNRYLSISVEGLSKQEVGNRITQAVISFLERGD